MNDISSFASVLLCDNHRYQIVLISLYLGLTEYSIDLYNFLRHINIDLALNVGRTYYFNAL